MAKSYMSAAFLKHMPIGFDENTPFSKECSSQFPFPTLRTTLYTLHFTLHTLHSTLYTPHFTLCTPHPPLHTPHFTLHTLHFTFYTPHSTLYTSRPTLYTVDSALHTLHFFLSTPKVNSHSRLHNPYFTLAPFSRMRSEGFSFYIWGSGG